MISYHEDLAIDPIQRVNTLRVTVQDLWLEITETAANARHAAIETQELVAEVKQKLEAIRQIMKAST